MRLSFASVRIAGKLIIAFALILCCTISLGLFAISRLSAVSTDAADLRDNWLPATRFVGDMARAAERLRASEGAALLATTASQAEHEDGVSQGALDSFKSSWAAYEPTITPPDETPVAEGVRTSWASYVSAAEKLRSLVRSGQKNEAIAYYLGDMSESMRSVRAALDANAQFQAVQGKKAGDSGAQTASLAFHWIIAALVFTVLVCVLVGLALVRNIANPVVGMTVAMRRLAGNDMSVEIPALGRGDEIGSMAGAVQIFKAAAQEKARLEADALAAGRLTDEERARNSAVLAEAAAQQRHVVETVADGLSRLSRGELVHRIAQAFPADYERLRQDFNAALAKLQDTISTVAASASTIRSGTGEISTASDDLSRRTEQQAASLEETAAALDEITATVRKTAEGARHARAVVDAARQDAEQSGQVVKQAVDAMSSIEQSSREINQIISVIDEIAFQTNLLALNAGVEAARAGEAGRGFAVVASEVRALAQRSADAAKEIKGLISTSSQQVEQGVVLVGRTGEALTRIVGQVSEINAIVGEIAASAQEQATGLDQVNTAVNQMDQVTQQNAAMVEETTAASHSLSKEAGELSRLIGDFQIEVGTSHTPAAPAVRLKGRSASRAVQALKTSGRGGAALQVQPAAANEWAEF